MLRSFALLTLLVLAGSGCSGTTSDEGPDGGAGTGGGNASGGGSSTGGAGSGGTSSATGGGSGAASPECEGIPRDTGKTPAGDDVCQVSARIREHCGGEPLDMAECYARWDVTRVDGCFLVLLEEERQTCEESDDWDWSIASARANPEIVTPAGLACLESMEDACDVEPQGALKACFDRAHECDAFEDLCMGAYTLAPAWSSKLSECVAKPCAEVEDCMYDLLGTPEDARR